MSYKVAYIGKPESWFAAYGWVEAKRISPEYDFFIVKESGRWGIVSAKSPEFSPFYLDFLKNPYLNIFKKGVFKSDPLARAIGSKPQNKKVLDTTAGWLKDSWILLKLGCIVTACEQNELVYALINDAIELFKKKPELSDLLSRLSVTNAKSEQFFEREDLAQWDVVYLDPMFPKVTKKALAGKEMQILQNLIHIDDDGTGLLTKALQSGAKRVVVKRPLKGKELLSGVNFKTKGKATRFDVYINAN